MANKPKVVRMVDPETKAVVEHAIYPDKFARLKEGFKTTDYRAQLEAERKRVKRLNEMPDEEP